MNDSPRIPFDCGVLLEEQLISAYEKNIDVIFVTNHNTLDGYKQILEYQKNHSKYKGIKIYPAEEITINNKGHVLAYGISQTIAAGMTLEETLDEIKKQNAVSCAAHPFALSNGIRENAIKCDMIESFNSNNVDNFSNIAAEKFAKDNNMITIAGSDSHVLSTFGRCINTIDTENNLDSILDGMLKRKVEAVKTDLALKEELFEHAHYMLYYSKDQLLEYLYEHHPSTYSILKLGLNSFLSKPNSKLWKFLGSIGLYLSKRVSEKVNRKGYSPHIIENRSWKTLISLSLHP